MSYDCEYIFVWESQPYAQGEPAALALATLHDGAGAVMADGMLYWKCDKPGLIDINFPIPPDQIFERGDAKAVVTDRSRQPHFPDPNADPIALLEAVIEEKDRIIADQYRELTAWRMQLEVALAKLSGLEKAV